MTDPTQGAREGIYRCEYDGFEGSVIGAYTTREGKVGLVLQQVGTLVVHVYRRDRLVTLGVARSAALDPDLAAKLNDTAAYVGEIRRNVIEECARVAADRGWMTGADIALEIRALLSSPSGDSK